MNPFRAITLPEYLFNPRQILVRLKRAVRKPARDQELVRLPWGSRLYVRPMETIGSNLWYYGIFDLLIAEAIHRLLDPGELALDIGANIGQMSSLMRHRTGPSGRVIAFEPHPELHQELTQNMDPALAGKNAAPVTLHQLALSDRPGTARLDPGAIWQENRGLSKIVAPSAPASSTQIEVPLATLDSLLQPDARVGLGKIDVEGHECQVLRGAARLLKEKRIRDIIFEDFADYPSTVHQLLKDHGYSLYVLHQHWLRPTLQPESQLTHTHGRPGSEYLATLDPARARERFQPWGWNVLRGK